MMNIIFGIVIDTFATLRNEKKSLAMDKDNICFICSLDRDRFEKTPGGFDEHGHVDHNVWNYLAFLYHLKSKEENDMTGIESDVFKRLQEEDISWIPVGRSLSLSEIVQGDGWEESSKQLGEIQTMIANVKRITQLEMNGKT